MGLGKVANIVQNNLGNLTGGGLVGIAGGIVGALMDKGKNSVQTNAAAAKILNKSPLELSDTSPTAHMKQNPYEYGTVWYPENVQNLGTGHYMLFDIIVNDKTTFQNTKFNNTKNEKYKVQITSQKIFFFIFNQFYKLVEANLVVLLLSFYL